MSGQPAGRKRGRPSLGAKRLTITTTDHHLALLGELQARTGRSASRLIREALELLAERELPAGQGGKNTY